MNEQTSGQESEYPEAPPRRRLSVADLFARVSVTQMTLAVLVAIFLWQWLVGQMAISDMRRELAEKIAQMDGASKANQILLERSQDQVRELADRTAALEARYAEAQSQRAALETLYNDLSFSRDETALAEVEQLLLIAGQQLQLSANVKAALIAMQNADARLQRMGRPAFGGLRKAIDGDMAKLRVLPDVDVTGINNQLDALMATVDDLPLVYRQRAVRSAAVAPQTAADESTWQRLLREIWQEARQLVRIEDTGKAEMPLLPPEQEFFLRENLKLRLMSARLALLSRDETAFRQEMKTAQQWVARYFDAKSGEGARMLVTLRKVGEANIAIDLPDISASLQAVRSFRATRDAMSAKGAR